MTNASSSATPPDAASPLRTLEDRSAALGPWFHNLHLPDGTQTAPNHPLGDFPAILWHHVEPLIPADLRGWRVLDVGCNAGFYSFQLAQRGAQVTAIDVSEHYLGQARWAAERFGLRERIDFRRMQVHDVADWDATFDLVWFMGVFYHLRYPVLALDTLARKTRRTMVFQTMTMPGAPPADLPHDLPIDQRERLLEPGWPRMALIENRLAGDPTNWWAADPACVEGLLRTAGLRVTARPAPEIYLCEPAPRQADGLAAILDDEYRAAIGRTRPASVSDSSEGG